MGATTCSGGALAALTVGGAAGAWAAAVAGRRASTRRSKPALRFFGGSAAEEGGSVKVDGADKANIARLLVDKHDSRGVFDFCGGMMFQLVLSEKLRSHLLQVAEGGAGEQPVVFDVATDRMALTPGYAQTADADNVAIFHGREVRQVPTAAGGMGFALQLSLAGSDDPEGWTPQEVAGYDGWGHDSQRMWRRGETLESEGYKSFRDTFGPAAYTLHHRFYLHRDLFGRLWLSAEDGCEGTPA